MNTNSWFQFPLLFCKKQRLQQQNKINWPKSLPRTLPQVLFWLLVPGMAPSGCSPEGRCCCVKATSEVLWMVPPRVLCTRVGCHTNHVFEAKLKLFVMHQWQRNIFAVAGINLQPSTLSLQGFLIISFMKLEANCPSVDRSLNSKYGVHGLALSRC